MTFSQSKTGHGEAERGPGADEQRPYQIVRMPARYEGVEGGGGLQHTDVGERRESGSGRGGGGRGKGVGGEVDDAADVIARGLHRKGFAIDESHDLRQLTGAQPTRQFLREG